MKKSAILCTLLFSLLLTACGAPAEEEAVKETSYQVLDADKAEVCVISDQAAVEEMNELINSFTSGEATPQGEEPIKPLYLHPLAGDHRSGGGGPGGGAGASGGDARERPEGQRPGAAGNSA